MPWYIQGMTVSTTLKGVLSMFEVGQSYKVTDTTGLCGVYEKGAVVVPITDKEGNLVKGANHPEWVMCSLKNQKAKALFFRPDQVEAA